MVKLPFQYKKDMESDMDRYLMEDVPNVPEVLKGLTASDLTSDPTSKLSLQERCEACYREGMTDTCVHSKFKDIKTRRRSLIESDTSKGSSLDLAQAGFFTKDGRSLTCFHCGQTMKMRKGVDPNYTHADLFRNCRQTCRNLGHPDRRPRRGTMMMSCPTTALLMTRRRCSSF